MDLYPPGVLIADQYEVASRPLQGGMGVVYLCLDHGNDGHPVALKTFKPEYLADRTARDRFLREGALWVNLGSHPHIVRCYRVVRVGDGREVYLVLELVAKEQGREDASLRSWLVPGKPLLVEQALLFALQIAWGMRHATDVIPGLVHRDLKPENVLVGADRLKNADVNRVRVTDFGLAYVLQQLGRVPTAVSGCVTESSDARPRLTQLTQGMVGTPQYMAPEQWRGEPVGVATDVYALGCMLMEMLSGNPAVQGNSLVELQRAHCAGRALTTVEGLPIWVRELAHHCLALEPASRYASWSEVENQLTAVYAQVAGQATPTLQTSQALNWMTQVSAGWSYINIGISYLDIGRAEIALDYFRHAAEIGGLEEEPRLEAAGIGNIGQAYAFMGDVRRAIGYYEQRIAMAREIDDRQGESIALSNLGSAYADLGEVQRAVGYFEQALAIHREVGDRRGESAALSNLGLAYRQLGEVQRAVGYFEQALAIHREVSDRRGEGQDLGNLGSTYAALGEVQRAVGYFEQALAIHREVGDRRGEGRSLSNLGSAYADLGEVQRAVGYFEQALAIHREVGDRRGESAALGNLGLAYRQLGEVQRAVGYFEQALAIHREVSDRRGEGQDLGNLGSTYAVLGEVQRAVGCFERALAIRREVGDAMGVAADSFNIALLYTKRGDVTQALALARQAAQLYTQLGHSEYAQRAQQLVAWLSERSGEKSDGDSGAGDLSPLAFEAFQRSGSIADMQRAVTKYPFMNEPDFIALIEQVIESQVPPQHRPAFEERLAWLRRIAKENTMRRL